MASPRRALEGADTSELLATSCDQHGPRRAAEVEPYATSLFSKSTRKIAGWRRSLAPLAVMAAFSTVVGFAVMTPNDGSPNEQLATPAAVHMEDRAANLSRSADRPEAASDREAGEDLSATPSATASVPATPSPTPSLTPSASPSIPDLGTKAGTKYVTSSGVNLRSGPSTSHKVVATLKRGDAVTITKVVQGEWQQVNIDGKAAWISTTYLTDKKPSGSSGDSNGSTPAPGGGGDAPPPSSGGFSTAPCKHGASIESGITANTKRVFRAFCAVFPQIKSYGGYRQAESWSYHTRGAAIDAMVSDRELGWRMAKWAAANADALKIDQVIYAQHIWTKQRRTWRPMADRGNITANHYDHVHISVG